MDRALKARRILRANVYWSAQKFSLLQALVSIEFYHQFTLVGG